MTKFHFESDSPLRWNVGDPAERNHHIAQLSVNVRSEQPLSVEHPRTDRPQPQLPLYPVRSSASRQLFQRRFCPDP